MQAGNNFKILLNLLSGIFVLKTTVYIPSKLYTEFNNENKLDSLSYFVQLKAIFQNPKFYNYKLTKLAELLKVSPNCLKHHLDYLKSKNLFTIKNNHLQLLGINKLQQKYGKKLVYVKVQGTVKETKYVVKSIPMLSSLARQCNKVQRWDKIDTNRAKKKRTPQFAYITLSNNKIKKLINRKSISTIQNWKSKLKSLNLISYKFKFIDLETYFTLFNKNIDEVYILRKNDKLTIQLPNQFRLVGKGYIKEYIVSDVNRLGLVR